MVFSNDWAITDNPADHSKFKDQPSFVRKLRTDLEERFANMFYGFTSGETVEGVKYLNFTQQASDPSAPAATGVRLYTKEVSGAAELYLRHSSAGVIQLTNLGKFLLSSLVAASQALGDIWYASSATVMARLAGNTTTTKKFLTQTGDGANSAAPGWNTIAANDVPADLASSSMADGVTIQTVRTESGAVATGSATLPDDDTVPTTSEMFKVTALDTAITPKATGNKIKVTLELQVSKTANQGKPMFAAIVVGGVVVAIAGVVHDNNPYHGERIVVSYLHTAADTNEVTFSAYASNFDGDTMTINGYNTGRKFGGVYKSSMTCEEIKV